MRRPVFVFTVLAVLLAPALVTPRTVEACTGLPVDPVEVSEIAFAGRVVDLRVAEELWNGVNHFVPVWIDFEVDTYLKGTGPQQFSALDPVSVIFPGNLDAARENDFGAAQFTGLAGACGALIEDPRGQYWVTGVSRQSVDGGEHYTISLGLVAARGESADDPEVLAAMEAARQAGFTPAATGHGVAGPREGVPWLPLALLGGTVALLAGGRSGARRVASVR